MKVLISGFTIFSSHAENSSQIIAEILQQTKIPGIEIQTVVLPVSFSSAFNHLKNEIDNFEPDYVICLGLAGDRKKISLEKVAINFIHSSIPDNDGVKIEEMPISEGPAAYFSTLPVKEMRELSSPFPVEVSFSAGAYVCNYLMYRTLEYLKETKIKAGFIHLPHLNENKSSILESIVGMISLLKS